MVAMRVKWWDCMSYGVLPVVIGGNVESSADGAAPDALYPLPRAANANLKA